MTAPNYFMLCQEAIRLNSDLLAAQLQAAALDPQRYERLMADGRRAWERCMRRFEKRYGAWIQEAK